VGKSHARRNERSTIAVALWWLQAALLAIRVAIALTVAVELVRHGPSVPLALVLVADLAPERVGVTA